MLSLYKLEVFSIVAQRGSFSAAADQLHMSQPGVSQHIHDLEVGLGTQLFRRGRRGVELTDAGEKLYEYTIQILHLVIEAESAVTQVENLSSGQLYIGATPGVSAYLLPSWIQNFHLRYPRLMVALYTGITSEVIAGVLGKRSDLGFIEGELSENQHENLGILALQDIELFVVIGAKHPWWGREAIQAQELNGQPFIHRQPHSQTRIWLEQIFFENSLTLPTATEFDNQESIKQAVISGMGITILPMYAVQDEQANGRLQVLPISDLSLRRTLKLIWYNAIPVKPIARAMLHQLSVIYPHVLTVIPT